MITSCDNKTVKLIKSLSIKKHREETGFFFTEGHRFTAEIPDDVAIEFYAISESFSRIAFSYRRGVEKIVISDNVFKRISLTEKPQGIIAVCRKLKWDFSSIIGNAEKSLFVVLDGLRDPGNLGAIIRSADAFGVNAIFLTENTVDLYNPKVLRSTMGSVFRVPVISKPLGSVVEEMKNVGIKIFGASLISNKFCYDETFIYGGVAVIIGNEAFGMSDEAKDACEKMIKIPMIGDAESLNAAVAASVIMYEALRQKNMVNKNA